MNNLIQSLTDQSSSYYRAAVVCSIISLVNIIFVLVMFLLIRKKVFNFFYNLGIYLLLSDIPLMVTSLFDQEVLSSELYCNIVGAFRVYSNTSIAIWNILICWTVHYTIKGNLSEQSLRKYTGRFILAGFIVPIFLGVIPIFTHGYTVTFTSCWISTRLKTWDQYLINALCYWGIIIISLLTVTVFSFRIIKFLKNYAISEVSGELYALGVYPIVFILCNAADIFDRVYLTVETEPIVFVAYIHIIMRQLQGFFHGMVLLLNPRVRAEVRGLCKGNDKSTASTFKEEVSFVVASKHNSNHDSVKEIPPEISDDSMTISLQPASVGQNQRLLNKYFRVRASSKDLPEKNNDDSSQKSFMSDTT